VLNADRQGIINAETISRVMGVDINYSLLKEDIASIKSHFADSSMRSDGKDDEGIDEA
jgi:hypothetical protein